MVTITTEELVGIQSGLRRLSELSETKENDFSFRTKYWISRLIKAVSTSLKEYLEENNKLLEEYGTEVFNTNPNSVDADGNPIKTSTGEYNFENNIKRLAYQKKNKILLETKVDLENVYKFKLSDLVDLPIGASVLVSLDPLIENDLGENLEKWNEVVNHEVHNEELKKQHK